MSKIYYIGDWAVMCGPVFAETPFNYAYKGLEMYNYGAWLKAALESSGEHQVTSVPTWEFYKLGPGEYEKILADYDVLIFSDVEAKNFQLAPGFFDRQKFGNRVLTFRRVRLTVEAIHGGKSAMFLGGWLSFTGEMGKGGWQRTRLREVLPVQCSPFEDLIESTEGFTARPTPAGEAALSGLDFAIPPDFRLQPRVSPRPDCPCCSPWPKLSTHSRSARFGQGKCWPTCPTPDRWVCNLVFSGAYAAFWLKCLAQLQA